jgi:hypothetical protein
MPVALADAWREVLDRDEVLPVAVWRSVKARHPIRVAWTLGDLLDRVAMPAISPSKEGVHLWSPTAYLPGRTRGWRGVESISLVVLDVDDGADLEELIDPWPGAEIIAHTSWSHTPVAPRWRVCLPLVRPVPVDLWAAAWSIVAERSGHVDPATKDASRIYYLPATRTRIGPWRGDALGWTALDETGREVRAYVQSGERLDLVDLARARMERDRREREERLSRRRERLARVRVDVDPSRGRARLLGTDPALRRAYGEELGGTVADRSSGAIVRGVTCPECGRRSLWWAVDPVRIASAMCEHRGSCGAVIPLWRLNE